MERKSITAFTVEELTTLMQEFSKHGLGKLVVKNADMEICLRAPHPTPIISPAGQASYAVPQVEVQKESGGNLLMESPPVLPTGTVVKAPIVGTFYESPAPDQAAFVQVGQRVQKGDVLFIIESMKLMNEVHSELDGEVVAILCENASAVEYDHPIMIIR